MAAWQRCERCRRVLGTDDFDDGATTCRACMTTPVKTVRAPRTTTVTRTRTAPRAPDPAPSGPRPALLGVAGSGDLEVRERRARRAAQDALAESHPEQFALLLRDARLAEGLRPLSVAAPPPEGDEDPPPGS